MIIRACVGLLFGSWTHNGTHTKETKGQHRAPAQLSKMDSNREGETTKFMTNGICVMYFSLCQVFIYILWAMSIFAPEKSPKWENMKQNIKEGSTDGLDYPSLKPLIYVLFLNRFKSTNEFYIYLQTNPNKMGREINENTHNQEKKLGPSICQTISLFATCREDCITDTQAKCFEYIIH